jgi:hypothetical protein
MSALPPTTAAVAAVVVGAPPSSLPLVRWCAVGYGTGDVLPPCPDEGEPVLLLGSTDGGRHFELDDDTPCAFGLMAESDLSGSRSGAAAASPYFFDGLAGASLPS